MRPSFLKMLVLLAFEQVIASADQCNPLFEMMSGHEQLTRCRIQGSAFFKTRHPGTREI